MSEQKKQTPPDFTFRIPSLPKDIYESLNAIAKHESCTQRLVVVAGIVALSHMSQHDKAGLAEVWKQARELAK